MPLSSRLLKALAWLLLISVAIVTLGPIGWRPVTSFSPQIERAFALFVVGLVFALAYPRRIVLVTVALFTFTALLEAAQVLEPSRHGRVVDLIVKLSGGGIGLFLGRVLMRRKSK